jgi:hypothetical protein
VIRSLIWLGFFGLMLVSMAHDWSVLMLLCFIALLALL